MRPFGVDSQLVQLEITDTAGQDDFDSISTTYMRSGKGFLLVYAIDDRASFDKIEHFHHGLLLAKDASTIPCVICGNKCDLEDRRVVSKTEGENFLKNLSVNSMKLQHLQIIIFMNHLLQ